MNTDRKQFNLDFLLSPVSVFSGIILGILIGFKYQTFSRYLIPFGDMYLCLLQMCILPVLITAVISSLGRMIRDGQTGKYIKKLVLIFTGGLIIAGIAGSLTGIIGKPGLKINEERKAVLGRLISEYEMGKTADASAPLTQGNLMDFVQSMIPSNIFAAFSNGQNLKILFFCIFLGIALGFLKTPAAEEALIVTEAFYDAFQKLISWVMYGLPFGLCALFAAQVSTVGFEAIKALLIFVILCYAGCFGLIIFYSLVIFSKTKNHFFSSFFHLKEPLFIALGTCSSFAAIPSCLKVLQEKFGIQKNTSNLVIPLGMNLNPHGSVFHIALSTVFIAQLYGTHFGTEAFIITITGSILAGMAAGGIPGSGSLSMLSLILAPLGLPSQAAIILLLAVDPIIDPILTLVTVHANCASAILLNDNIPPQKNQS